MPESPAKPPSKPPSKPRMRRAAKANRQPVAVASAVPSPQFRFAGAEPSWASEPLVPLRPEERTEAGFTHRQGKVLVRVETEQQSAERKRRLAAELSDLRAQIESEGGGMKSLDEILEEIDEARGGEA